MVRMTLRFGALGVVLVSTACAAATGAVPASYSAKAIHASAVDVTTARPVPGVIVVAQWVLRGMGGLGPTLHILTTRTDEQGRFSIPAWGPKLRPPQMELGPWSPRLILFKSGYVPLGLLSQSKATFAKDFPNYRMMPTKTIAANIDVQGDGHLAVQDSVWDGLAIQLEPFQGTPDEWLRLLDIYSAEVRDQDASQARAFFEAIRGERAYFRNHPVGPQSEAALADVFVRIDQLLK